MYRDENASGVATIWLLFYVILLVIVGGSWSAGDKPTELLRSAVDVPNGPASPPVSMLP